MVIYIRCICRVYNNSKNKECTRCGQTLKPVRYYIRITDHGKRYFEYAGDTIGQARLYTSKRKVEISEGSSDASVKNMNILFEDYVDRYFIPHYESKNKSPNTEYHKFNTIIKFFKDVMLDEIKSSDIERFYQWQLKINSPATAKNRLAIVRRMLNYAVEMDFLKTNPTKTKPVRVSNERTRVLSAEELPRLLDECKKSKNNELYDIVFIALNTGMRKGEILRLNYSEDIKNNCIYIKSEISKSGKERIIPINDALQHFLSEKSFEKFSGNDFREAFKRVCERAKVENFTFHCLRHTFASNLANSGVDLYTIQILLGHSTPLMTQRYAHKNLDSLIAAVNKIGGSEPPK